MYVNRYDTVGKIRVRHTETIPKPYRNKLSPTHLNFHLPCLSPEISSRPAPYSMHPSIRTNRSFHAKASSWIILSEPRTTWPGSRRVALASVPPAGVGSHPCWAINDMATCARCNDEVDSCLNQFGDIGFLAAVAATLLVQIIATLQWWSHRISPS